MKKTFTRILAMLITAIMVISLVPAVTAAPAVDAEWLTNSTDTEGNYVINDAADLLAFNAAITAETPVSFTGKTVKLGANIALNYGAVADFKNLQSAVMWNGHGVFTGTFDGNNKYISGLYIDDTTGNTGFFGQASGTIKNLTLINSYIQVVNAAATNNIGGLVGSATAALTIENCKSDVEINVSGLTRYIGGFIGQNVNNATVTIDGCSFTGSITSARTASKDYVGGFIGYALGTTTIKNSVSNATLTYPANSVGTCMGGFIGGANTKDITHTVENCISDCKIDLGTQCADDVTYSERAGGIMGFLKGKLVVKDTLIAGSITKTDANSVTSSAVVPSHNGGQGLTLTNVVIGIDLAKASHVFTAMYNTGYKSGDLASSKSPVQPTCTDVVYVTDMVNNTVLTVTNNGTRVESTEAPAGATATTSAAILGNKPAAEGWANWEAVEGKLPVPTAAKALYGAALPELPQGVSVVALGDQYKDNGDSTKDYRVVSLVYGYDILHATGIAIGYKFTMTYDGNEGTVEETYYCSTAYKSIMANGQALAAADYDGADFFVTMTFKNVPDTATNINITVTPFVEAVQGTQVYGQAGDFIWNETAA